MNNNKKRAIHPLSFLRLFQKAWFYLHSFNGQVQLLLANDVILLGEK